MTGNSRPVLSSQAGISGQLEQLVKKHLGSSFDKPYRHFSEALFEQLRQVVDRVNLPIILDAGCGNGDSSAQLAKDYPDNLVVGIDKSQYRLSKYLNGETFYHNKNLFLARGDLVDTWRYIAESGWRVDKQYILYPNPWPKANQVKRRWHGHPVFATLVNMALQLELRTNWKVYADEFLFALHLLNRQATIETVSPAAAISPFEQKYMQSEHVLYRVTTPVNAVRKSGHLRSSPYGHAATRSRADCHRD